MIRLAALSFGLFCLSGYAADQGQLDANETLFSVMAAVNAGLPNGTPAVHEYIAEKKIPCLSELRNFVDSHKKNGKVDWSPYVSLALSSGEAPDFKPNFTGVEEPPDLAQIEGFRNLLIRFYEEAGLNGLWRKLQPAYDRELARYHEPVTRALLESNAYLRNPTSGYMGRRFLVYVEVLAPPNQIHTRSYKDDYYIVLTTSQQPQIDQVRHAYLHYLLDPLTTKYSESLMNKRSIGDFAQGAAGLNEAYKSDFLLLSTECLIRAVESRLDRKPKYVQESLAEGFILTPFFAEALPAYEKQEAAMRMYFPEMMATFDLRKETKRLDGVDLTIAPPKKEVRAELPPEAPRDPSETLLDEAEKLYTSRDLEKASQAFRKVLQQTQKKPLHARAYYGLARIATLQRQPQVAEDLFRKTLDMGPDGQTRAWAEVYLGKLAEMTTTPEDAIAHYKAALAVEGASEKAKQAAKEGLAKKSP